MRFYDAPKAAKTRLLKVTEHSEINDFTNMVAKIDTNAREKAAKYNNKWGLKLSKNREQPVSTENLLDVTKKNYPVTLSSSGSLLLFKTWKLIAPLSFVRSDAPA